MSEVLISADAVSKKYCRSLKRSLWYGVQDMASEALGRTGSHDRLRKDEFWAVEDVSFELRRGECLGLIGHNGAGKTTLLKILNGLIKPDHGTIRMRGRVAGLIALGAGFNPILSGRENIHVNASVLGLSSQEIGSKIEEIIDFADIRKFIDAPVQSYSSGMAVRLGFSVASAVKPDILLLDEVLAVGDMAFQAQCFNRLGEMRRNGTAFILVSHNMHQIARFSDRALLLRHGHVEFLGRTDEAVSAFTAAMTSEEQGRSGGTPKLPAAGSGTVTIDRVSFRDRNDREVTELQCHEPVDLVLDYRCHVRPIEDPVVDITLRLPSGDAFFQATSRNLGLRLGTLEAHGQLTFTFESIPANNVVLTAGVALWDARFEELLHWRTGLRLRVRGIPLSTGTTALRCTLQHKR